MNKNDEMEAVIDQYFRDLFRSSDPSESDMEAVLGALAPRLTEEDSFALSQPFTVQEVKDAISHMSPLKSPGPDGFPAFFYQKYCHILGSNVISCALNFLNTHALPPELNYTFIVLIPRLRAPKK